MFSSSCNSVQLLHRSYVLEEYISVYNKSDITLRGTENVTQVTCLKDAGLNFTKITSLTLSNLIFLNCGHLYQVSDNVIFAVAVLIMNANGLLLSKIEIRGSNGTGLGLWNVKGEVNINDCTFAANKMSGSAQQVSGGGGVYLELNNQNSAAVTGSYDSSEETRLPGCCVETQYSITGCNFTGNAVTATNRTQTCEDGVPAGISLGGGLSVRLRQQTCGVRIFVSDSSFRHNSAGSGGGVELEMCRTQNNFIQISNTNVTANTVTNGGGGFAVSFVGLGTKHNKVQLQDIHFTSNSAVNYGGGLAVSTRTSSNQVNNSLSFLGCTWELNSAHYASALDIFPAGVVDAWNARPEIAVENSTFDSNYFLNKYISKGIFQRGEGVIMVTGLGVRFKGDVTFKNNTGSCIYAVSSKLEFDADVNTLFLNNSAEQGAGIALIGLAIITVHSNSVLTFCNNTVSQRGGAIFYYSIDKHFYVHKNRCFIQKNNHTETTNARVNFFGNTAPTDPIHVSDRQDREDSAIFTTVDLKFCCPNVSSCTFDGVGNFTFSDTCSESMIEDSYLNELYYDYFNTSLSTSESSIEFEQPSQALSFVPGQLTAISQLDNNHSTLFDVSIKNFGNSNVSVVKSHHTIHTNQMILMGNSGDRAELTLTEKSSRQSYLSFQVNLSLCPPFYKLVDFWCECYTNKDTYYVAFFRCEGYNINRQASLREGYWVGYNETDESVNKTFLMSYCPNGYCNSEVEDDNYYNLTSDLEELDKLVCEEGRRGRLCGECLENMTVFFYSRRFICGKEDLCHLGLLFYLLSEILPLTILFLLVIFFNISFTSGSLNGFIFFTQMYDAVADVGGGFQRRNRNLRKVQLFHQIIYRFFNLDFFGIDSLSFCLWKNASTLSILAFKYVTVIYAFVLVLVTIGAIRICNRYRLTRLRKSRYSVIQGLSAFLVLAYSQCTEVSFSILNPINIHTSNNTEFTVVFLQGNIGYYSKAHIPYAIPALLCIVMFVYLVPLVLIAYPLCNKVLARLGLAENRFVNKLLFPIIKIKPLLDCFQGTFKDEYRFFAGLYFFYRATILASRFAPTIILIYAIMVLQFIIMLTLHTTLWPYQKRSHNIIDTLLIANLAIIAILKLLHHNLAESSKSHNSTAIVHLLELIFVSLPLLVLVINSIHLFVGKIKKWCKKGHSGAERESKLVDALLDDDLREQSLNSSTDSYMLMRERQLEMHTK